MIECFQIGARVVFHGRYCFEAARRPKMPNEDRCGATGVEFFGLMALMNVCDGEPVQLPLFASQDRTDI